MPTENALLNEKDTKHEMQKGIGRFSTQRLGHKLTIVTQTIEDEMASMVEIDWNNFERDSKHSIAF